MILIPASRQIFSASVSLGTTARAAGVSIAARYLACTELAGDIYDYVAAGEGDIESTTRRTRGLVHPNHLLLVGRQITAKGREFVLAAPAFILLGKREKW